MKKYFKKIKPFHLLTLAVLSFVLYQQIPILLQNMDSQGIKISAIKTEEIVSHREINFPPQGRSLAIFWSTTCPPCRLEMKRLKSSVQKGDIDPSRIYAINMGETKSTIKKFLNKNPFPFQFINYPALKEQLGIRATPTTIFIEDNTIHKINTGISIIGIWHAESFLN